MPSAKPSCPVCGGTSVEDVLTVTGLPVAINAQTTPEAALSVPRGDIDLVVCTTCTHLFNSAFDPTISSYDSSYENSLHFSPRFREYAGALARRLVDDHGLAGKTVAEAGSGPGHFLALLCEAGVASAFGFDPSYDPDRLGAPDHPSVHLSQGLFPSDDSFESNLSLSQHVLEHLVDPIGLLRVLRDSVDAQPGGVVYTEVPNGGLMVSRDALWDLIYEHYSYFTPLSLAAAVRRAGLSADRGSTAYDDQFLAIESAPGEPANDLPDNAMARAFVREAIAFGERARSRIERARLDLERHLALGPVALWGAGSKGMTYLNIVAPEGEISAIIDVNPRKAGCGIPGVPGVIECPAALMTHLPATVLIANPIYAEEISARLAAHDVAADVLPLWD